MKDIERFAWAIAVIIALGLGCYAGFKIEKAIADIEIMDLQAQLETTNASLADANIELAFWRDALTALVQGNQLKGVNLKGRPSKGD